MKHVIKEGKKEERRASGEEIVLEPKKEEPVGEETQDEQQ